MDVYILSTCTLSSTIDNFCSPVSQDRCGKPTTRVDHVVPNVAKRGAAMPWPCQTMASRLFLPTNMCWLKKNDMS